MLPEHQSWGQKKECMSALPMEWYWWQNTFFNSSLCFPVVLYVIILKAMPVKDFQEDKLFYGWYSNSSEWVRFDDI